MELVFSRKVASAIAVKDNDKLLNQKDIFPQPIEGYYLETLEGLFFAVKGLEHPQDRTIAILRYAPDAAKGNREKGRVGYRRLYRFAEQEQYLQAAYPEYRAFDLMFQTTVQSVPKDRIRRIYDPRLRLQELTQTSRREALEEDAVAFAGLLQKEAAIPTDVLGITGSLLIGLHTELSDLDIAVYGIHNCQRVHQALGRLLDTQSGMQLHRLDAKGLEQLHAQRVIDTRMDFHDFVSMEKNKRNQGRFRDRTYFIRFIKELHESGEPYGHRRYTPLGRLTITASVAADQESFFTPCRYRLAGVCSLQGPSPADLTEVVSFRGRFCEQARTGQSVLASGTLEHVQNRQGEMWHRLLLGNFPEDTLLVRR